MGEAAAAAVEDIQKGVVVPAPKPSKGVASWAVDLLERLVVRLGHDKAKPLHWLSGNFAPIRDETPPAAGLPVRGHLPVCTLSFFSARLAGLVVPRR
jgi:carotenoid cleavage dioxygenase